MFKKILCLGAACVLGIVGICALGGCGSNEAENKVTDNEPSDEINEIAAPEMVKLNTWFFTSGVPNNVITVTSERENAEFHCSVLNGEFWSYADQQYCKQVTLSSDESTWWHDIHSETKIELDFVEIIVEENNNIVGYSVIKITSQNEANYSAEVLKASYFENPVTQEQIESIIEKVKNKNSKG